MLLIVIFLGTYAGTDNMLFVIRIDTSIGIPVNNLTITCNVECNMVGVEANDDLVVIVIATSFSFGQSSVFLTNQDGVRWSVSHSNLAATLMVIALQKDCQSMLWFGSIPNLAGKDSIQGTILLQSNILVVGYLNSISRWNMASGTLMWSVTNVAAPSIYLMETLDPNTLLVVNSSSFGSSRLDNLQTYVF